MADEPTHVVDETIAEEVEPPQESAEAVPDEGVSAEVPVPAAEEQPTDSSTPAVTDEAPQEPTEPTETPDADVKEDGQGEPAVPSSASATAVPTSPSKVQLSSSKTGRSLTKVSSSKAAVTGSKTPTASPSKIEATSSKVAVTSSKMKVDPTHSKTGLSLSRMALEGRGSKGDERGSVTRRRFSAERRSSAAKRMLSGSILSFRRHSYEAERAKIPRYMNTYRLESKNPFKPERVTAILNEVLTKELEDARYDPATTPKLAMAISAEIRARVKVQLYDRYKIVCVVDIGEKQMQSLYSAFRFLWDIERDKYAMVKYENMTMFAVACCFGIYYE